ncbi:hypothetical protein [Pontiella agarivorans]|uniref:DUF560 domain-containing protein n=1 Tax=Pontiella agarivorans TaxID=3038953 RepID=A0ABU5MW05_9BACT|nr:hypothetical protein [Pontiella agarivorans]MDZ8118136.1 hypothetical protein [Pontiella agarivorans]
MEGRLVYGAAGMIGLLSAVSILAEPAAVEWDLEGEAAVSAGYKNNMLQSSVTDESSAFIRTAVDASMMRFSETGSYLLFYLFGEDTRYSDAPSVNYEQMISALFNGAVPAGTDDRLGAEVMYLYLHQIYDASETQVDRRRLLVLGHSLSVRPYWDHEFSDTWSHRFEFSVSRQIYEVALDDYRETGGRFLLTRKYGHRSELSAGFRYMQRDYDTREQFDGDGLALPGTDLLYFQHELQGEWRHYFDADRHWRSLAKWSGMMNRDNGSGYFDYDRLLLREQLRWDNELWRVKSNVRFGWYFYKVQQVSGARRERSYVSADLRIERRFGEHISLFAEAEHAWNFSNDPLDEYNTWTAHTGFMVSM